LRSTSPRRSSFTVAQFGSGDKVRFLAPRGSSEGVRRDTWIVRRLSRSANGVTVSLLLENGDEETERAIEDLVVIADCRDPIYPGLS
jgi:adenine-specific DNA-methyltransferase